MSETLIPFLCPIVKFIIPLWTPITFPSRFLIFPFCKVSDKEALYVLRINSDKNEIIVGPKENLGKKNIILKNLNLLVDKKEFENDVLVKVRSTGKLLEAKVDFSDQNGAYVNLKIAEDGISPGQACVFYNKDKLGYKVLGGGWIKE